MRHVQAINEIGEIQDNMIVITTYYVASFDIRPGGSIVLDRTLDWPRLASTLDPIRAQGGACC
jgi:hypothetical protein